jgi:hypothetical protein
MAKKTMYFTQETEDAIVRYNAMTTRYSECCGAGAITQENVDIDNIPKLLGINARN